MPTDRELQAAHALAQPLTTDEKSTSADPSPFVVLHEAIRILTGKSIMLPGPEHLAAMYRSRMAWQAFALKGAELLIDASATPEMLAAANTIIEELRLTIDAETPK